MLLLKGTLGRWDLRKGGSPSLALRPRSLLWVWGLGLGFGVWGYGLGFRAWGLGLRV